MHKTHVRTYTVLVALIVLSHTHPRHLSPSMAALEQNLNSDPFVLIITFNSDNSILIYVRQVLVSDTCYRLIIHREPITAR